VSKITKAETAEAIERLRAELSPGDTVYTVLRNVSASGMTRSISVHTIENDQPNWISWLAAKASGANYDDAREAVKMGGAGMDMGFALVYNLSYSLWPNGFDCIGDKCPSNDHSNYSAWTRCECWTPERDSTRGLACPLCNESGRIPNPEPCAARHADGGYALRQRWI